MKKVYLLLVTILILTGCSKNTQSTSFKVDDELNQN